MVGKITILGGLFLAIPTLAGPELPPHIYDIDTFKCVVENHPIHIHYDDNSKPDEDVDSYEAHAFAHYKDGIYPEYRKLLRVDKDIHPTIAECTSWYMNVKKAKGRK